MGIKNFVASHTMGSPKLMHMKLHLSLFRLRAIWKKGPGSSSCKNSPPISDNRVCYFLPLCPPITAVWYGSCPHSLPQLQTLLILGE